MTCNDFYWFQNKLSHKYVLKKWTEYFPSFNNADILIWHRIIKLSFLVTRETRLQTFQYLLIHRLIPCNNWLCDKKIKCTI